MTSETTALPAIFALKSGGDQTFIGVLGAELGRLMRRGVWKVLLILVVASCVIGAGMIIATALLMDSMGAEAGLSGSTAIEWTNSPQTVIDTLVIFLGIYIVCATAREHDDGQVRSTLMLVPNRIRLYTARILSWIILAAICFVVSYTVGLLADLPIMGKLAKGFDAGTLGISYVLCLFKCVFTAILAFGLGTILRRVSLGLLCYLVLQMIGGMALGMVGGILPHPLSDAATGLDNILPGTLLDVLTKADITGGQISIAVGILIVWAVLAILGSLLVFRRVSK